MWVRSMPVAAAIALASSALPAQQAHVVRSTGPGAWGARLRVIEEIRIGALDGWPEQVFGRVDGIAAAPDGTIYVADAQVPVVRAYDSDGRFLRNLGREGEGPGEYRTLLGVRTVPDGGVATWDVRNGRITVFERSGAVRATYRVSTGFTASDVFQVDQTGHFYVRGGLIAAPSPNLDSPPRGWIRVSPTGAVLDTIPIPDDTAPRPQSFSIATAAGFERPFTRELVTAMSSLGYLITGRTETYALELHRPEVGLLRIEREHTALRLTTEERAEWLRFASYMEGRAANPTSTNPNQVLPPPRQVRYEVPLVKPAFRDLRTDSEGRIWVRRYVVAQRVEERNPGIAGRPPRTLREAPTFDVFEPQGRFLGTVVLPMDVRFHDARGRHIWATVQGRFDETYVVRYRVETIP